MAESGTHARLVEEIIAFAGRELGGLAQIAVRDDSVRPLRGERPPRIGGHVPDVYAVDVPTTHTLIGEAKTKADLETEHTRRQLISYLDYLAVTPGGILVLAVSLVASATAKRLITQLASPIANPPHLVVIDGCSAQAG